MATSNILNVFAKKDFLYVYPVCKIMLLKNYCLQITIIALIFSLLPTILISQSYPWERPLRMAWSTDGTIFNNSQIFQDSSGVPSIIRWKGDTLVCAFQWFRVPINSPTWDRVAVKFSYDNGMSWTAPEPIVVNGLPPTYQRPFDPALTVFGKDSIRIFYSSSDGIPKMGLDTVINTYSAVSTDGIHYTFEPGPRVDVSNNRVIDPSVIQFKNLWHYLAPVGSPQQGAYHYISTDGLTFTPTPVITSDNMHNWTGNYMIKDTNELRFYGSGQYVWYNSSSNGGIWNGFRNTNIQGGDPTVVKITDQDFLMVYVGNPYPVDVKESDHSAEEITLFPNLVNQVIHLSTIFSENNFHYQIYSMNGKLIDNGILKKNTIDVSALTLGFYYIILSPVNLSGHSFISEFIKM